MPYRVAIPNSKPPLRASVRLGSRISPKHELEVTLMLRGKKVAGSHALLSGTLPVRERRHLDVERYIAEFGADPKDIESVRKFAARHRLEVVTAYPARRAMILRGNATEMERAFGVELRGCHKTEPTLRTHKGEITVPKELGGVIVGVFGLDNRPACRRPGELRFYAGEDLKPPPVNSRTRTPAEFAKLYGFPKGATGKNECVAVLEFGGGFDPKKLHKYLASLGVAAPRVIVRDVPPGANKPLNEPGKITSDAEVYMDLEILASAAPGAKLVVYFAENTNRGWIDALTAAIFDKKHRPSVLSISWGQAEEYWDTQTVAAIESLFQAAAMLGITICCSSGDRGVFEAGERPWTVPYPASSPHVIACGGTRLDVDSAGIQKETVWNQWREAGLASGGGISLLHSQPGYQRGYRVPARREKPRKSGRGIPDVSANASSQTGYKIIADDTTMSIGGTSAAAPLWAALVACLNQKLRRRIGYLTPLLYTRDAQRAGAIRSIRKGNNKSTDGKGYVARKAWDPCTGLGSPRGSGLLKWLKK
jgi:kumamolisin